MQHSDHAHAGFSLLFLPGTRPTADDILRMIETAELSGTPARVSFRPEADEGWLELLSNGLVFDLVGLAPADFIGVADAGTVYGFDSGAIARDCEAIRLQPGEHIGAGAAMPPVIRTLARLTATMALNLPVVAVFWPPAATLIEPRYFVRIVLNWLGGGAFPALGLTALGRSEDGAVLSKGLSFFIGQELHLEGAPSEAAADTVKLAIRVIDFLVREGPLREACRVEGGPDHPGQLLAEPSQFGNQVWVWRGA